MEKAFNKILSDKGVNLFGDAQASIQKDTIVYNSNKNLVKKTKVAMIEKKQLNDQPDNAKSEEVQAIIDRMPTYYKYLLRQSRLMSIWWQ